MKSKFKTMFTNMMDYQNAVANSKKGQKVSQINPFKNLSKDFASHLITDLSQLPLKRNSEGLVSSTDTLTDEGNDLIYAAGIAYFVRRSYYAPSSSEFCFLTPYLMWAHKYKNNVMYEEWDKKDPMIDRAMGKSLTEILNNKEQIEEVWNNHRSPEEITAHREHLYPDKPVSGWPRKTTVVEVGPDDTIKMPGYAPLQKMYLQCWKAHGSLRHVKANILNPLDWDDTPEVYDEVTAIQPQQQPQPKPSASRDLPW